MSTHNICFRGEIRKILCGYPLLSVAMTINYECKMFTFVLFTTSPDQKHGQKNIFSNLLIRCFLPDTKVLIFFLFLQENICCTHNICFCGEIRKYLPDTHSYLDL